MFEIHRGNVLCHQGQSFFLLLSPMVPIQLLPNECSTLASPQLLNTEDFVSAWFCLTMPYLNAKGHAISHNKRVKPLVLIPLTEGLAADGKAHWRPPTGMTPCGSTAWYCKTGMLQRVSNWQMRLAHLLDGV